MLQKRTFRQMVVAQVVSALTVLLCLMIDSIMIGRFLGEVAMAAYGLANPVVLIFAAVGTTLSAGIQVVCGQKFGKGDQESTNAVYSITIVIYLIVAAAGMLCIGLFSGPIASLLGAGTEGQLFAYTKAYLLGFVPGIPLFLAALLAMPFLQMSGKQTRLIFAVGLMIVCDVAFDLLNVFVFKGEMLGMSLASSFSYFLPCVVGIGYFLTKKCVFRFRMKLVRKQETKEMLRAGIPSFVNLLSNVFLAYFFNQILLEIGQNASSGVAAYSIISTGGNVCYAFTGGIGAVALMLAGVYYYENDKRSLHSLLRLTVRTEIVVAIVIVALVVLFAPAIVGLFVMDGAETGMAQIATTGLRIVALSVLFNCFSSGIKQFYQGVLQVHFSEGIAVVQNFICPVLSAFILSRFLGITGVWLGMIVGEFCAVLFIVICVFVTQKSVKLSAENFAMLPRDFGVADEHYLRAELTTSDEVAAFSAKAYDFCENHQMDVHSCRYISLCMEEIGTIIVRYGDEKKKEWNAEVSMFYLDGTLVIRFRDSGKPFNPSEYYRMIHNDDPLAHPGIKMVFRVAKDVKYTNSMSQNTVTLSVDSRDFVEKQTAEAE